MKSYTEQEQKVGT